MKKSNFVALVLGVVSGILFSLGMCLALVEEWAQLKSGIVLGTIGLILGLITVLIWRKMENKPKIKLNKKRILIALYTVFSTLVFGVGMCLCLVLNNIILGTIIGLVGIVLLLLLIPILKGIKWKK